MNDAAETARPLTSDDVLDFSCTIIDTAAKARRRDSAMNRAHLAGHAACEICGRAIKGEGLRIDESVLGPTCAKKMRAAGYAI